MNRNDVIEIGLSYPIQEIVKRYASDKDLSLSAAAEHELEAKRYLILCALNPEKTYSMRGPIDEFWHTFVTFTSRYMDFCERIAGTYIHHFPNTEKDRERYSFNRGPRGGSRREVSKADLKQSYLEMLEDYRTTFKADPQAHFWPRPIENDGEDIAGGVGCFPCRCGCRCIA